MPKKVIEDIKSKGVKITKISKKEVTNTPSRISVMNTEDFLNKIEEGVKPVSKQHILKRDPEDKIYSTPTVRKSNLYVRKNIKFLFLISILLGGTYFISNLFEKTTIIIKQKTTEIVLNKEQLSAFNTKDSPINFELMIVPESETKEINLTEKENVSIKARGEVTFYNEYSTNPQKLLIHTFISDSAGKAYQTDSPIIIPGYKLDKSKKIIPGQASVGITSFLAGDSYNGSPNDFSINSFKGTAKAKKIYAKLKSPLKGGAQGIVYKPSPEDMGVLNAYAASTFKSNLLKRVNAQVPPGYILYPEAMTISSNVEESILSQTPTYKAKITGLVSSVIINQSDLSRSLIKRELPNLSPVELTQVKLDDIPSLKFNFSNTNQTISKDIKSISFTLSGKLNAVWSHDIEQLKKSYVGVSKYDIQSIFKSDPGISQASVKIFPPWNKYLSTDVSKIDIKLE